MVVPGTIIIVASEDSVLSERQLKRLKQEATQAGFVNPWRRFSAKDMEVSALIGEWQSLSFFGGEVFVVSGCETWKKAEWDAINHLLDLPLSSHLLILCGSAIDGRLQIVKRLKDKGCFIALTAPERRQWVSWAMALAQEDFGLASSEGAMRLLGDVVGEEPWQLVRALEQLALYSHPRSTIDAATVAEVFGQLRVEDIFAFTKSVANRERKRALYLLGQLLAQGIEALYLLAMLRRHYRGLIALGAQPPRLSPQDKARVIGCAPYFVKEYDEQLRRYSQSELVALYHDLALIDQRLKCERTPALLMYSEWIIRVTAH